MSGRKRKLPGTWVLLCAAGWILACGERPPRDGALQDQQQAVAARGGEASIPQRVVTIAPSVTEMMYVLGLGDRVAGVGDYARWPPEVAGKPRLGGLFDSRLETITGLNPDLAVLLPSEELLRTQLVKMGVEVLSVRSDSIDDVEEMAVLIGERFGVEEASDQFVQSWRQELAPRDQSISARVLLSVTRDPGRMADVLVSGPDTFLHELIERLGATNVMADAQLSYPEVGLEEVILRRPEVVIELQASPANYDDLRFDWAQLMIDVPLGEICVQVVAGDHVLIPGPRLPRLYRELEEALLECADKRE